MAPTDGSIPEGTAAANTLPAPVRTPTQRRVTIAALSVAAVIVAAGIFGGGMAVGLYANWDHSNRSVTTDNTQGGYQQWPGNGNGPSFPDGSR